MGKYYCLQEEQGLWDMVRAYDFREKEEIGRIFHVYFIYKARISLYRSQFLDRNLTEKKP